MLIDNKTQFEKEEPKELIKYFREHLDKGDFDLVTGYFTIGILAYFYDVLNKPKNFRMILGSFIEEQKLWRDKAFDILQGKDLSIQETFRLSDNAKKAVLFLEQDKVQLKTTTQFFCHAKSYIYHAPDRNNKFYVVGSSNLTSSGLGQHKSANIELNVVKTGGDNDFKELTIWYNNLWNRAENEIKNDDKYIDFKTHIINRIKEYYKHYTPEDIYCKILFELFKKDVLDGTLQIEQSETFSHLKDSEVYKKLYNFQKKGVLSLIKMLQRYNGAILADAVGLGKTWQALAVIKFFELEGYEVVLFCPKKLEENWRRYKKKQGSLFDADKLDYEIRFHTDLQDERMNKDGITIEDYFQNNPKILFVIDESHNLRNDKSNRYQFLVEKILTKNKDVKTLLLSATPINNNLKDIRNQFKLLVKGQDNGFANTDLAIDSLQKLFGQAERKYKTWQKQEIPKLSDFINMLPQDFFELTDSLIVARTRKLIKEHTNTEYLVFPKKLPPQNIYKNPENIGELKTFDDILKLLESVQLTAYRPAQYTQAEINRQEQKRKHQKIDILKDEGTRQKFLVKMMFILMLKRLESSWRSFQNTINNILAHHENAMLKINTFIEKGEDSKISDDLDDEQLDEIEDTNIELNISDKDEEKEEEELTLGKRNPIALSDIQDIETFKNDVANDIEKLKELQKNLLLFQKDLEQNKNIDNKLEELVSIVKEKQKKKNKKLLIFTVYKDTAQYLFESLKNRGFKNIAYVSGQRTEDNSGYNSNKFEPILQRFAPYTKLYNELDWNKTYKAAQIENIKPSFKEWQKIMKKHRPEIYDKLQTPIDILIATDCLSEGQNLQDCDCVVNYDIHWNPVRLIQRFGRIDRIGSINKEIKGINFFPAQSYDDYLKLKKRIEQRLALMVMVGSEIVTPTKKIKNIVDNNPLYSKQTAKMLEQLQTSWDDIEMNNKEGDNLGLNDFSLEDFRAELLDMLSKKKEELENMSHAVFSGFKVKQNLFQQKMPKGIVALLGHAKDKNNYYEKHILVYASPKEFNVLQNNKDILSFLRKHKKEDRFVPETVENGDKKTLKAYQAMLQYAIEGKKEKQDVVNIFNIFQGSMEKVKKEEQNISTKVVFNIKNLDLITWLIIS